MAEQPPAGERSVAPGTGPRSASRASALDAGRRPTIYDVARAAGVSHQTVTRYLSGFEGIRPATRERVRQALMDLDYRPNLAARALTSGRSHRIGALTHEINKFGPGKIVQGATEAAREAGYVLDIVTVDVGRPEAVDEAIALLRRHDLAGVLALSSTDEMTDAFEHAHFDVPVFNGAEPDEPAESASSELTTVGFPALIGHLAGLGHHDLLHIAGPPTWSAARNRARAYEQAVDARGLKSVGTIVGDWSARSGYEAVQALSDPAEATAIVAANDQMALGAILALTELGLQVPGDVSVTGVDDIPEAAYFQPPLTTLRVDFERQGRAAFARLHAMITGEEPAEAATLHSELVVRRSTAPPRG